MSNHGERPWLARCEHDAASETAVVGVPDAYCGETVKAYASLRPGQPIEPDQLIEFGTQRRAADRSPHHVEVLDELPRGVTGTLLRRELRTKGAGTADETERWAAPTGTPALSKQHQSTVRSEER